ncbi:DUF5804 family protein [Halomarina oriensis]|uniref:Uncharacterized protein n=1 Tax=Halomarina oriensis TaxID=671145 RepID=A0A6B0GQF8_9EURY|nr:DUF5804 family protein [Halomarina oriensis]MWG33898.1 hypothetical protein [Halomarina oriensis]
MTTVCLVGTSDCDLRYELLSRETARDALATYSLDRPFENSLAVETISLGAAVSFVNDLAWYLVRFVETTLVREPSISESEWLSRDLAAAIRDGEVTPAESERYLKVYGVERPDAPPADGEAESTADDGPQTTAALPRLVEPMFVARTGPQLPEYDLRDVGETLVVRVTEAEFGG